MRCQVWCTLFEFCCRLLRRFSRFSRWFGVENRDYVGSLWIDLLCSSSRSLRLLDLRNIACPRLPYLLGLRGSSWSFFFRFLQPCNSSYLCRRFAGSCAHSGDECFGKGFCLSGVGLVVDSHSACASTQGVVISSDMVVSFGIGGLGA